MSAVLLAVFDNYETAEHVRVDLIRDGFPTDRVELTCSSFPGRAAVVPATSPHDRFVRFFRSLFSRPEEQADVERIADCIDHGNAAVTVLPRGLVEISRASRIIQRASPREIKRHDLTDQTFEYAASRGSRTWISSLWVESGNHASCLYCRLFERSFE
jgi:hypothetical protein